MGPDTPQPMPPAGSPPPVSHHSYMPWIVLAAIAIVIILAALAFYFMKSSFIGGQAPHGGSQGTPSVFSWGATRWYLFSPSMGVGLVFANGTFAQAAEKITVPSTPYIVKLSPALVAKRIPSSTDPKDYQVVLAKGVVNGAMSPQLAAGGYVVVQTSAGLSLCSPSAICSQVYTFGGPHIGRVVFAASGTELAVLDPGSRTLSGFTISYGPKPIALLGGTVSDPALVNAQVLAFDHAAPGRVVAFIETPQSPKQIEIKGFAAATTTAQVPVTRITACPVDGLFTPRSIFDPKTCASYDAMTAGEEFTATSL